MRLKLAASLLYGFILVGAVGCSRTHSTLAAATKLPPAAELGVEQLAKHPEAFSNRRLALRGVVATIDASQKRFTVIDVAEYNACRELGCSSCEVPVTFSGALPETARTVRITGRLEQAEPGRYLVVAQQVEVVR